MNNPFFEHKDPTDDHTDSKEGFLAKLQRAQEAMYAKITDDSDPPPALLFGMPGGVVVIPCAELMQSPQTKDQLAAIVRMTLETYPWITRFALCAASWVVMKPADFDEETYQGASQDPNREEAVIINYESRDGDVELIQLRIVRDPGNPTTLEPLDLGERTGFEGRFSHFFPQQKDATP